MNAHWKIELAPHSDGIISPSLWGQNLEITRSTMFGGLSAQLVNNRKFFADNSDAFARGWKPVGACRMVSEKARRLPEIQLSTESSGIVQESDALKLRPHILYRWRLRLHGAFRAQLQIKAGSAQAEASCRCEGESIVIEGTLSSYNGADGRLSILAAGEGCMILENISLLPENAVLCGLRPDVIAALRATHPYALRFPGGCYAEFYDWKQGLLAQDERDVIHVEGMDFLLSPTLNQDPADMNLDDFVAVCRMVGAQPQFTVGMTDATPEDVAALVEYANGSAQTHWGAVRAARGFAEPYGIRRWYVGNEIFPFVEGMKDPIAAAKKTVLLAKAMKKVDPSIELVPSNWALSDWNAAFMAEIEQLGGTSLFARASYHQYLLDILDDSSDALVVENPAELQSIERIKTYLHAPTERILPRMRSLREELKAAGPQTGALPITMDEWNYYWHRPGHPVLALYMAGLFNVLVRHSAEVGIVDAMFFHPVNEGLLRVTPEGTVSEDGAKAWQMARRHAGGHLLPIVRIPSEHPVDAAASINGRRVCVTLVNRSLKEDGPVILPELADAKTIVAECWKADPADCFRPNSMRLHPLSPGADGAFTLPPLSMACIQFEREAKP